MYKKMLQDLDNVEIMVHSPRAVGETEARSNWLEVNYYNFAGMTVKGRAEFVRSLAKKHKQVVLKTATAGGRARIFVSKILK